MLNAKPIPCLLGVLVLALAAVAGADNEPRNLRFRSYSLEDGLSQVFISSIAQDSQGFIWLGTQEGLNRFDGYEFVAFSHDPEDPTSISNNLIKSILVDESGALWIGTDGGGLNRFDPATQAFRRYRHDLEDATSLSHDRVRVVFQDRLGRLWVGTDGGGLNRFDRASGRFIRYRHDPDDPRSLGDDRVRSIADDPAGYLWVATEGGGLSRLHPPSGHFDHLRHDPEDPTSLPSDRVRVLYRDREGALWAGTYDQGLARRADGSAGFQRFQHRPEDPTSLSANEVRAIYQERDGALWVGTDEGLNRWRPDGSFSRYLHDPADLDSISHSRVMSIFQDGGGVLWVGTLHGLNKSNHPIGLFPHIRRVRDAPDQLSNNFVNAFAEGLDGSVWVGTHHGLNRLDPVSGTFRQFLGRPEDPRSLSDDQVMALEVDHNGALWVGTLRGGLNRLAAGAEGFDRYPHHPSDPRSLSADGVTSILEDSRGRLWVGTYRGGLNRFDPASDGFDHFRHDPADPASLSSDRVLALFEDRSGALWVGTHGGGLNRLDPDSGHAVHFRHDPDDPTSLSNDYIFSLAEDARGNLWVGTQGGGLDLWTAADRDAGRYRLRRHGKREGLLSDTIYAIQLDRQQRLWLSTNRGLSRLDPLRGSFKHYNTSHGLQSEEFNHGAALRTRAGQMLFGGINGFNAFHPDRIGTNASSPPVVLTKVLRFNKAMDLGPLHLLDELWLSYRDSVIAFEFAALDFAAPELNRYQYRLEGFDRDWVDNGTRRRVTYTNLEPGDYTFRVRGSNNDGVWSEQGLAIRLHSAPPPWRTGWAYGLYLMALGAVVTMNTRSQMRKRQRAEELAVANRRLRAEVVQRRAKERALQSERLAKEAAESASRAKSQFLANMSHEIRTPMSTLLGNLELLRETGLDDSQTALTDSARRSASSLLDILNDVLDLSKIEAGKLELETLNFALDELIDNLLDLFSNSADQKGLELSAEIAESTPLWLRGDPTRLRQILSNLVGNAIKFTQAGKVSLRVSAGDDAGDGRQWLRFAVRDTGVGLDSEARNQIFDSFSQADGSITRKYGGTGLGLSISKQLVEMMSGQIGVESAPGRGSVFWFEVPLERQEGRETVTFDEIAPQSGPIPLASFQQPADSPAAADPERDGATVLLVDDNADIRLTVVAMIERLGVRAEAVNHGLEAVEAVARGSYDLIFMDCQMPILDGYEATRRIRQLEKTGAGRHRGRRPIPIVALTASALAGDLEKCLAFGMDDYLCKPFTIDALGDVLHRHLGDDALPAAPPPQGSGTGDHVVAHSTGRTAGSAPAVIDYDALRRIGALGGGSPQDLLPRVVRSYLETASEMIERLRQAVDSEDERAISASAHRLKGSSAQLGVERIAGLCAELEHAANGHDEGNGNGSGNGVPKPSAELLHELQEEFGRVRAALEEECPSIEP